MSQEKSLTVSEVGEWLKKAVAAWEEHQGMARAALQQLPFLNEEDPKEALEQILKTSPVPKAERKNLITFLLADLQRGHIKS